MNTNERIRRIREVERATERLTKKGWRVEAIQHTDEPGEPFRTTINLATEGDSELGGTL